MVTSALQISERGEQHGRSADRYLRFPVDALLENFWFDR